MVTNMNTEKASIHFLVSYRLTLLKIYCSFETKKAIDQTYFKEINEIFHSSNRSYVVGKILLSDLKELESKFPEASIISMN